MKVLWFQLSWVLFVGFIAAIMGVGGAFLMVPAMIYLIGMPTKLVPGTSLFVTIFITGFVVVLHAFTYNTIDLVLVLILISGSIAGVHSGQKIGQRLQGSELKTLLALLMLSVGVLMAYDTFFRNGTPSIQIPTDKIVEISEFGNTIFNLSIKISNCLWNFINLLSLGRWSSGIFYKKTNK